MSFFNKHFPAFVLIATIIAAAAFTVFLLQYLPDFALSANPDSTTVLASPTSPWTAIAVNVRPLNSFTGIVSLAVTAPTNATAGLSSTGGNEVAVNQVSLGEAQNLTLSVSVAYPTIYTVTVTGTSGRLSHSVSITVLARGLRITTIPNPITVAPGSSTGAQLTLISENGLSGNFSIVHKLYPTYNPGLWNVTGIPSSIVLSAGGSASFSVLITTQPQWPGGSIDIAVYTPVGSAEFFISVNAA